MDTNERTTELLIEIRDLVQAQLDDFRAANEKQAAAVEESLARQAQSVRFLKVFLAAVVVLYVAWMAVSAF